MDVEETTVNLVSGDRPDTREPVGNEPGTRRCLSLSLIPHTLSCRRLDQQGW